MTARKLAMVAKREAERLVDSIDAIERVLQVGLHVSQLAVAVKALRCIANTQAVLYEDNPVEKEEALKRAVGIAQSALRTMELEP